MILEKMARDLGLSVGFIRNLSKGASHEYKSFSVPKRNGGFRVIHHPSRRLKALQRWLLYNVIENLPVHDAAKAYRKNYSILDNARAHVDSRYLLRMDLVDFFPSIKVSDIFVYISDRPAVFSAWSRIDIDIFLKLVCRDDALTIGAPSSPGLSNVICYELDSKLRALCDSDQVTYTRYADDLFFSSTTKNVLGRIETVVPSVVRSLRIPTQLRVNASKTRHSSKRGARRVTGIVLGSDGKTYVGRAQKRKIRAMIHKFETLRDAEKATLAGLISYVIGFDPHFINSLILKYGLDKVKAAKAVRSPVLTI